ncbi:lysosome-associated membrane glycoprotein 1 [Suncus etruscus]|uniref:lysosome-associated membrane glycoprotein 1 n=1 Tax=Suncus etruscus TaxID=109475 RepID=UPI00211061CA|nr:lysosome-associated membrane glycoprotein 1 [Suncus etruscus]
MKAKWGQPAQGETPATLWLHYDCAHRRLRNSLIFFFWDSTGLVYSAAEFVVKDTNGTNCIMANFSVTFRINYDTTGSTGSQNTTLALMSDAHVLNSSSCRRDNVSEPTLMIALGKGHILTLNFTKNMTRYSVKKMSLTYNLSDRATFSNASSNGTRTADSQPDISADIDKKYTCASKHVIPMGARVTAELHNVTIQAYLSNNTFSPGETRCAQDGPAPTPVPPTPPHPSPPPTPEVPSVNKYNVSGANGTCLLASMGLQLNITKQTGDKMVTHIINVNPNKTTVNGTCSAQLVTLELLSERNMALVLQFAMNTSSSRFFLQGIQLNVTLPEAKELAFHAANTSLKALEASVGNSYKCNAEQQVRVTEAFSLNMYRVWLQAFRIDGGKFGSVEECQLDENSMLIPIAVGGALAGLVLIVLIAYLIGRKRSHAGYQTI